MMEWIVNIWTAIRVLFYGSFSLLSLLGALYLIKEFFPAAETVVGRLLRFLGWAGKWMRRASVSSQVQGPINQVISTMNSEFEVSMFPACTVKWVTAANKESTLEIGKVVVRLSFHANNDVNTFNAAQAYAQTAILPRTKPFLSRTTARAIDLVLVKSILLAAKRTALMIFNSQFRDEDKTTKDTFFKLEEIQSKGLFTRILLQELHYFGELLGERTPSEEYEHQAEEFVQWLHKLAIREHDERSDLTFERSHLKVGVILVAREETLRERGIDPYLRWASTYASRDFHLVYILARGRERGGIAKKIASLLTHLGAFDSLTKRPDLTIKDANGEIHVVTCLALKPNSTTLLQIAWERLKQHFDASTSVAVTVQEVYDDHLVVDAYGLQIPIPKQQMSALEIPEVANYFRRGMELSTRIEALDPSRNEIAISNVNSTTDPKRIVEQNLALNEPIRAVVRRVLRRDNVEIGVELDLPIHQARAFLPRKRATHSRFVNLTERFIPDSVLQVRLLEYDFRFGSYVCQVADLVDPWERIDQFAEKMLVSVEIREVAERYINVEILEGLEGRIYADEVSWGSEDDNLQRVKDLKPGENCKAVITKVDKVRRSILLSIKRCVESPAARILQHGDKTPIKAVATTVRQGRGVDVRFPGEAIAGFIPVSEITWGYCDDISKFVREGETVNCIPLTYSERFNTVTCSIKRTEPNDFDSAASTIKPGSVVEGTVKEYIRDGYRVVVHVGDKRVQACLHRGEISNFPLQDRMLSGALEIGKKYPFIVKQLVSRAHLVELGRRGLFQSTLKSLEYGKTYSGRVLVTKRRESVVYSDLFEALIVDQATAFTSEFQTVTVMLARKDDAVNRVEVVLA